MSDKKKFRVIFTGGFTEGMNKKQVIDDLARLFKTDPVTIVKLFSEENTVIKKQLDPKAAQSYLKAIQRTGAICRIEEEASPNPQPDAPAPGDTEKTGPRAIACQIGKSELIYTPVPANRITACPDGIHFNRMDAGCTAFSQLALVSVFLAPPDNQLKILFFIHGRKRPIIGDGPKIAYADFPDVRADSMVGSSRNLIHYLYRVNNALCVDAGTQAFINGAPPQKLTMDPDILATALGKEIGKLPPPKTPEKAPGIQGTPSPPPISPVKPVSEKIAPVPAPKPVVTPSPAPTLSTEQKHVQTLDNRVRKMAFLSGVMLIAGFLMPLLKSSVLFNTTAVVWPWQIMGMGMENMTTNAAMATLSSGKHMLVWGLLPLIAGGISLFLSRRASLPHLSMAMVAIGAAMLILLMTVLIDEAEILGLMFVPPTTAAGVMMLIMIVSGMCIAIANYLQKRFDTMAMLKWFTLVGGFFLVVGMGLQLLIAEGGWKGWSMILLYMGMILYGAVALTGAIRGHSNASQLSTLLRVILWWAPVACLIAQRWSSNDFVGYVIGGGGGLPHIFSSVVKCFLIYYGSAFLMAAGLCGVIGLKSVSANE